MKKWLKLFKFFVTAPGWLKGLLVALLVLCLLLAPVLGIVALLLLPVAGLLWLILKPIGKLKEPFK